MKKIILLLILLSFTAGFSYSFDKDEKHPDFSQGKRKHENKFHRRMFQFKKLQDKKLKQEMKALGKEIQAKKKIIRNLKEGYKLEENEEKKEAIVKKLKQEITNLSLLRVSFAEKQVEASKRLVEFATEFYARSCVQLEQASYMARNEKAQLKHLGQLEENK